MDTTAKKATGDGAPLTSTLMRAGSGEDDGDHGDEDHAATAAPACALSLDHIWWPGTAPSRLKAKSMREQLVMQAMVQKNWPTVEMSRTVPPHLRREGLGEDQRHAAAALGHVTLVLHGEEEGEQQEPAADGRVEDRPPDALGRRVGRRVRLLREVGRGVVAGDRVLGQQRADGQDDEDEARSRVSSRRRIRCC